MGDPNGLCFFGGKYHVCFQHYPDDAERRGRTRWGHFESKDLISWRYTGAVITPDTAWERDGAYSGCAVAGKDKIEFFYTGNVKESGEHDYIKSGRHAYVLYAESRDGVTVSGKKMLLSNADYPFFCSCHVRDPAVFFEGGVRKMVLGVRTLDDVGCALFYREDAEKWTLEKALSKPNFGYMWECPNVFEFCGQKYLSICPQGAPRGEFERQNENGAGYFPMAVDLGEYCEWDSGFDFYAPQTFRAPDARVLLLAWMGVPNAPYDTPAENCLTFPRELSFADGSVLQNPAREIISLRRNGVNLERGERAEVNFPFDMEFCAESDFKIRFCGAEMKYESGVFSLSFEGNVGAGRDVRHTKIFPCDNVRVIADASSIEVFLAGGRKTVSTRFFPRSIRTDVSVLGGRAHIWELAEISVL